MRFQYLLKVQGAKNAKWMGTDGEDAARNYMLDHPGAQVVAWKEVDQTSGICALNHHSIIVG